MKTKLPHSVRNTLTPLIAGVLSVLSSHAAVIDFESSQSYDNDTTSQTFGSFSDIQNNASINRVTEGGNSFLRYTAGSSATTAYDTTPGSGSYDTFSIGIGETLTVAYNIQATSSITPIGAGVRISHLNLGLFTEESTGINLGIAARFTLDTFSGANQNVRLFGITGMTPAYQTLGGYDPQTLTTVDAAAYRLQLEYTNLSLTQGNIKVTLYGLTSLDSTSGVELGSYTDNFTYGAGSSQINMDPANVSLYFGSSSAAGVTTNIDNVSIVPEPSIALLTFLSMCGLSGWRRMARNQKG